MNKLFATTLLSTAVAFSVQAQDVTGTIHANQGTQKITTGRESRKPSGVYGFKSVSMCQIALRIIRQQ